MGTRQLTKQEVIDLVQEYIDLEEKSYDLESDQEAIGCRQEEIYNILDSAVVTYKYTVQKTFTKKETFSLSALLDWGNKTVKDAFGMAFAIDDYDANYTPGVIIEASCYYKDGTKFDYEINDKGNS